VVALGLRPQQRRERAERRIVHERLGRWLGRRPTTDLEAVVVIEGDEVARAFEQQTRLLATTEVAGGIDQMRGCAV